MIYFDKNGFRVIEKSDLDEIRYENNYESTVINLGDPSLVTKVQQFN